MKTFDICQSSIHVELQRVIFIIGHSEPIIHEQELVIALAIEVVELIASLYLSPEVIEKDHVCFEFPPLLRHSRATEPAEILKWFI